MTQLTNQEIFDKALFGIRAQNYQRSVYDYSCRYRGENGTKCAVGHCIDDETAAVWDKLTDTTISGIAVNVKIRESFEKFFNLEQIKFLMQLQRAHDVSLSGSVPIFENAMQNIAISHGLHYTEPQESKE